MEYFYYSRKAPAKHTAQSQKLVVFLPDMYSTQSNIYHIILPKYFPCMQLFSYAQVAITLLFTHKTD